MTELETIKELLDTLDLSERASREEPSSINGDTVQRDFWSDWLLETRHGVEDDDFPELTDEGRAWIQERLNKIFGGMSLCSSISEQEKGWFSINIYEVVPNYHIILDCGKPMEFHALGLDKLEEKLRELHKLYKSGDYAHFDLKIYQGKRDRTEDQAIQEIIAQILEDDDK